VSNILRAVFAYELIRRDYFLLYPQELGMKVEEFIYKNGYRLKVMTREINRDYQMNITKVDQPNLNCAISDYLNFKRIRNPIPGTGVDYSKREINLESWKQRLGPFVLVPNSMKQD
jgi:hypothetical protein